MIQNSKTHSFAEPALARWSSDVFLPFLVLEFADQEFRYPWMRAIDCFPLTLTCALHQHPHSRSDTSD